MVIVLESEEADLTAIIKIGKSGTSLACQVTMLRCNDFVCVMQLLGAHVQFTTHLFFLVSQMAPQ